MVLDLVFTRRSADIEAGMMEQFPVGSDGVRHRSENLSGTAAGLQGLQALEGWEVPRSRRSATIAPRRRAEEI